MYADVLPFGDSSSLEVGSVVVLDAAASFSDEVSFAFGAIVELSVPLSIELLPLAAVSLSVEIVSLSVEIVPLAAELIASSSPTAVMVELPSSGSDFVALELDFTSILYSEMMPFVDSVSLAIELLPLVAVSLSVERMPLAVQFRASSSPTAVMVKLPLSGSDVVALELESTSMLCLETVPFVDSVSVVFTGWIVTAAR